MSQHYDNPTVISYPLLGVDATAVLDTRVYAPPPGKTRGRLVSIQAAVTVAIVGTTNGPIIEAGVSGSVAREGSLEIPDTSGADTGHATAPKATSVTEGFGFGQGNPNDQSVAATAEDLHITTNPAVGGLIAGTYDAVVTVEWF